MIPVLKSDNIFQQAKDRLWVAVEINKVLMLGEVRRAKKSRRFGEILIE